MRRKQNIGFMVFFFALFMIAGLLGGCDSADNRFGLTGLNIFHAMDEQGTTYYVNVTGGGSHDGTIGNEMNLTEAQSYANIHTDEEVTFLLENGDYGDFTDSRTTTGTGWVTYRAVEGEVPIFDHVEIGSSGEDAYVELDGLHILNQLLLRGGYVNVKNCDIQGGDWSLYALQGVWLGSTNVLVENCELHNGQRGVSTGGVGWTIRNNRVYDISEHGIRGGLGESLIEGNEVYDINPYHDPGFWMNNPDPLCRGTNPPGYVYNNYDCKDIHSDGIFWDVAAADSENIIIRNNTVHSSIMTGGGAIFISADKTLTNLRIENNLVYGILGAEGQPGNCLDIGHKGGSMYFNNNTFIGEATNFLMYDSPIEMYNNIFEDDLNVWDGGPIYHGNNIFGAIPIGFTPDSSSVVLADPIEFENIFIDYNERDFRPKADSIACNGDVNGMEGVAVGALECAEAAEQNCTPSLTNTSWSSWLNISCLPSDLMNQSRNRTEYDSNNCGEVGNTTYTEYRQTEVCDYCTPSLTNTSWSSWLNISCLASDLMNQSRNRTEYDSNNCGEISNTTYTEYRQTESCDYCTSSLTNTSWSSWTNITCLASDLINQSRNKTEYDSNNCGEVSNVTYFEYRTTESCDYCSPSLTNTSWSSWLNISCLASDLMNQSRNRTEYDSNNCGEISNVTYRQYRQSENCDYCTPSLTNTSWSSWTNITCLPGDLMNQSRYRIQYDFNNCCEIFNLTFYEYRATEYCRFLDNDGDNISDNMDCNDFNISINLCRGCLICNDTVSSNESRGECKPSTNVAAINRTELGCPLPIYDKFSRNLTTNMSRINLTSSANASIGITGKGKIKFVPAIDLYRNSSNVFYPLDMDSFINITDKKISLDSDNLPELNVSCELTFYNVSYSNPVVRKNGEDFSDYSVLQLPNSSNDYAMVINVSSFTYYEIVDNSTEEEDSGDDTATTSSGGGGGGGGGSLGKRISLGTDWNSVELRVNEKVLFDYGNENHHIFVDRINADSVDISVYSDRVALNLKEGRWAKVDLDNDNKNDIDVMYYGPNGSKAKIGVRLNSGIVAEKGITEEIITEETVQDTIEQEDNYEETQPEILEEPSPAKKSFILRYWIVLLSVLLSLPVLFIVVYAATGHMHNSLLKWKYFNYFSKEEARKRRYGLSRKELKALKGFVNKCRKWHYPKERIIKACVDVGWKKEVIEKVVEECGKGRIS